VHNASQVNYLQYYIEKNGKNSNFIKEYKNLGNEQGIK